MHQIQVCSPFDASEKFYRGEAMGRRRIVMNIYDHLDWIWPQFCCYYVRSVVHGVNKLTSGTGCYCLYHTFGDSVLMVRISSLLICSNNGLFEHSCVKGTIVSTVFFNCDTMRQGEAFEHVLGFNRLFHRRTNLEIDEGHVTNMINKYTSVPKALKARFSF